jgi:hypothetical protein
VISGALNSNFRGVAKAAAAAEAAEADVAVSVAPAAVEQTEEQPQVPASQDRQQQRKPKPQKQKQGAKDDADAAGDAIIVLDKPVTNSIIRRLAEVSAASSTTGSVGTMSRFVVGTVSMRIITLCLPCTSRMLVISRVLRSDHTCVECMRSCTFTLLP